MKKYYYHLILMIMLISCQQSEGKKNDLSLNNLKGRVKYIKHLFLKAEEESGVIIPSSDSIFPINKQKANSIEFFYSQGGYLTQSIKKYYIVALKTKGEFKKAGIFSYYILEFHERDTNKNIVNTFDQLEDEPKELIKKEIRNNIDDLNYQIFTYDSGGDLVKMCNIKTDHNGNSIQEEYFEGTKLKQQIFNKYSDNGLLIEEHILDEHKETLSKYFYDKKGNNVKREFTHGDTLEISTYKYNEYSHPIEFLLEINGSIAQEIVIEYQYDKNDMKTKVKRLTNGQITNEIGYKYDSMGNWIEKTMINYIYHENLADIDKEITLERRVIGYY